LAILSVLAGCTIHQSDTPSLTGPSEFGLSVNISATPDSINRDGSSQSVVAITAHDPTGQPQSGVTVRLDMAVGGVLQDFGTLSARTVVTGSNGTATAIFTAPPPPPPAANTATTLVTIVATASGTNAQGSVPRSADIRLMPVGVILPPAGSPT